MIILGLYRKIWYVHVHSLEFDCHLNPQYIIHSGTMTIDYNKRVLRCQLILEMLDEIRLHDNSRNI